MDAGGAVVGRWIARDRRAAEWVHASLAESGPAAVICTQRTDGG
jgi:hypothetical protein